MQDILASRLLDRPVSSVPDRLRTQSNAAAGDKTAQLQNAAKEFEALFLGYMLSVMRETIEESGLTDKGMGQTIYTELFDQELARTMAERGALGISDLLMRKLADQKPSPEPGVRRSDSQPATSPSRSRADDNAEGEVPDFRMPVHAHFSSSYGMRKDPFTHEVRMHRGVDIAAPEGMSVQAASAGRVLFAGYERGYGNTVVVQHPDGFETRYAHLGKLLVNAGDLLQAEQALGTVGNTGRSTGPHLHFEVSRYGNSIDPKALLTE